MSSSKKINACSSISYKQIWWLFMGLDDRDYTKRSSSVKSSNNRQSNHASGYVDVETFMQDNYAKAAKERDAGFFTKIKNRLFRLFK